MLISARIHLDLKLEDRIQFILKEYEYICKDETNITKAMDEIEIYSVKKASESWEDLVERSSYKDLVLDLRDFFHLLTFISKEAGTLDGQMFFIAPKIDFRQACAPHFLCEWGTFIRFSCLLSSSSVITISFINVNNWYQCTFKSNKCWLN